MILLLLLACSGPKTVADCARLGDEAQREDCRFELVKPLMPAADHLPSAAERKAFTDALEQAMKQIDDPKSRDLLLLRLAIAAPPQAGYLCSQVTTDGARQKCQQVLGRPHLGTMPKAQKGP